MEMSVQHHDPSDLPLYIALLFSVKY